MDFVKSITQAATQASIAAERVQHVSRVYERNRAASQNTVDTLTKLATGNLTSAAELLNGASGALSVATDLSPKVGEVTRGFRATAGAVGSVLRIANASNHPQIHAAAQTVTTALKGVETQFAAVVGTDTAKAVKSVLQATGLGAVFDVLGGDASSATPHLLTLTTEEGRRFNFGLSTAAFDKLRRTTRYKVASQERLNRPEALQAVSQGGETIVLSGVVFAALGAGARQLEALRAIGGRMKPVQLTAGTGDVLGRWYLQSVEEEQEALMSDGAPRKQTFSLEFGRYGEDFKNI
ncbi:phage P2 GpU family protein [Burkholderia pseudomallei ABCPW 30]|uniref:phage tail protein n=1 Tax=Burkholderia pseudomallei TaxID=28450 RepID=UPI00053919F8|nr:phage tail protein [Burkholderia pseudomallei]KGV91407.1 phage P2 GpU family protein [Burkholderia pseudomallei ABCPW 30]